MRIGKDRPGLFSLSCYTLLNFRKNPTGGVSIEMAEPIGTRFYTI
jgi:hypothetical protein